MAAITVDRVVVEVAEDHEACVLGQAAALALVVAQPRLVTLGQVFLPQAQLVVVARGVALLRAVEHRRAAAATTRGRCRSSCRCADQADGSRPASRSTSAAGSCAPWLHRSGSATAPACRTGPGAGRSPRHRCRGCGLRRRPRRCCPGPGRWARRC
ncbi:hypothetical protein G6F58_012859 [Rhizopus delemar]|nr:hypothetical protein G6F58_012859 [Rhizopus delemar]